MSFHPLTSKGINILALVKTLGFDVDGPVLLHDDQGRTNSQKTLPHLVKDNISTSDRPFAKIVEEDVIQIKFLPSDQIMVFSI